ncbi:MAG: formate--tetrahydrofolate ligase [Firmicutes bacterium]|nr:formate--tetrahydrofolate ligase [Bacillota bacterium]
MQPITTIASKIGIKKSELFLYGDYMAKIEAVPVSTKKNRGKLILVTAINPTTAGEGKTTVAIGLADAFTFLNKKAVLALREPSLGPVFGLKGGAAGGGRSLVVPREEIDLHFTGDFHALTSANNLLCALIDNHIYWGNELGIHGVVFNRVQDVNDRALRNVKVGGGYNEREDHFYITAASELMAIFCLANDEEDLKYRLGNIIVGYTKKDDPVYARDLLAVNAMMKLLKQAIKPNLVQTLEGTPAIVHGGPFANIAHGCNTLIATKMAMQYGDYAITEAGFGADLGAQKFLDIKCRVGEISPDCVVVVATVRALKLLGGAEANNLIATNEEALTAGLCNLQRHINNIKEIYNRPVIVAINEFKSDKKAEMVIIEKACKLWNVKCARSSAFLNGGEGAVAVAEATMSAMDAWEQEQKKDEYNEQNFDLTHTYKLEGILTEKILNIASKIYKAKKIEYTEKALDALSEFDSVEYQDYHVCIAKTPYSFSDDPSLLGAPEGFTLTVNDIQIRNGAKFFVVVCGQTMLMPGFGKVPRAVEM